MNSSQRKGKTLEEIYGLEKSREIKNKLRKSHLGQKSWNKDTGRKLTCKGCNSFYVTSRERTGKSFCSRECFIKHASLTSPKTKFEINSVPWNKGIPWSDEVKKKISKNRFGKCIGENNPLWEGGKSFEPYTKEFNKRLKDKIKKRDKWICQLCQDYLPEPRKIKNNPSKNWLTIHHIDYNKMNCEEKNLITLCHFCNISVNTKREQWTSHFNKVMEESNWH